VDAEREAEGAAAAILSRLCRYLTERSPQPTLAVEGATHVVVYVNDAFARLVGRDRKELVGRPLAETVPEGAENGCVALLDRVFRDGVAENLAEQEHRHAGPEAVYWSYAVWPVLGDDGRPIGVVIQVADSTETAVFRRRAAAMNEALLVSSVRQHELTADAEALNARLREAHDRLEGRVSERTAELTAANAALRAESAVRAAAEADRRELFGRLSTAQEDERRRIARELHDQMGQLLAGLGLGLKAVEDTTPAESPARPHLTRLRQLVDLISREAHQIALELRPTVLDDMGLSAALASYAETWSGRSGIEVAFRGVGPNALRLPAAAETALYRVAQEALTNVLRHARAGRVSLILQCSSDRAVMVVEDDGVGFEVKPVTTFANAGGHLGLLGMQERMALVGGTLTVESPPGQGTTVIASVPLAASAGGR
jgi:PAS domain S-box-containing protein